jgi:hypothetical protein
MSNGTVREKWQEARQNGIFLCYFCECNRFVRKRQKERPKRAAITVNAALNHDHNETQFERTFKVNNCFTFVFAFSFYSIFFPFLHQNSRKKNKKIF